MRGPRETPSIRVGAEQAPGKGRPFPAVWAHVPPAKL